MRIELNGREARMVENSVIPMAHQPRWTPIEKRIRGYAFLHHTADAEDFIQEALLALWQMVQEEPSLWQNTDSYLATRAIWKACHILRTDYRRQKKMDKRDITDLDCPTTNNVESDVLDTLTFAAGIQEIVPQLPDVHQAVLNCLLDALGEGMKSPDAPFTGTGRIKRSYLIEKLGRSRSSVSRSLMAIVRAMRVSEAFTGVCDVLA